MFKIPNWSSFQSYKDRSPPWIRLHKRLLDDYNFHKMSDSAQALLPMLWLLVAEDSDPVSGMLRIGYEEISFRLRKDQKAVKLAIDEIIRAGFLERENDEKMPLFNEKSNSYINDTEMLRNCHSETETETDIYNNKNGKKIFKKPDDVTEEIWIDFLEQRKLKKAKVTNTALAGIRNEATKAGFTMDQALQEICSRGWTGFKADWIRSEKNGNTKIATKTDRAKAAIARAAQNFGE